VKTNEATPILLATKMFANEQVSGDIRFMPILAKVLACRRKLTVSGRNR